MSKDKEPKDPSAADDTELPEEALETVSGGIVRRTSYSAGNFALELNGSHPSYLKKIGD